MDLIDWAGVARNALWIMGLSGVLAAWSHAMWWAAEHRTRWWRALARPAFQGPGAASMFLFAAGLAWAATQIWERIAWVLLALVFAMLAWQTRVGQRPSTRRDRPREPHEEGT